MQTIEASIWGWSDTNVNWSLSVISQANYHGRKIQNIFKLITTSSDEAAGYKQRRCTCTAMIYSIVGRHMRSGEDESGLG
eukprot:6980932-Ditylum_brightwellii.AAC.1